MPTNFISRPAGSFNRLVAGNFPLFAGGTALLGPLLWFICIAICFFRNSNHANFWVLWLYSLPVAVQAIGLVLLYKKLREDSHKDEGEPPSTGRRLALEEFAVFYFWTTLVCYVGYMLLSVVYMMLERAYNWTGDNPTWAPDAGLSAVLNVLSYAALVLICWLLFYAVRMTRAIVSGYIIGVAGDETAAPPPRRLDSLKTGAAQAPFLVLLFFFTVFLGVSHLFGLALAFHDKSEFIESKGKNPALYMRSIRDDATPTPTPTPCSSNAAAAAAPVSADCDAPGPYTFDFEPASALLNMDDPPQVSSEDSRDHLQRSRKEKGGVYARMSCLAEKIIATAGDCARTRVEIIGHSDKQDIVSERYKSNQELALARAENVRYKIMKELSFWGKGAWHEVEWFCTAESNEGSNSRRLAEVLVRQVPRDPVGSQVPHLESQLRPIINTEKPHPLDLMDYVYFANYTITTTGYGDIIPNTPRSKFICSFANICEVFFLVVLFNTLLTLKQDKSERESQWAREVSTREATTLLREIRQSVNKDLEQQRGIDALLKTIGQNIQVEHQQHASVNGLSLDEIRKTIEANNAEVAKEVAEKVAETIKDRPGFFRNFRFW